MDLKGAKFRISHIWEVFAIKKNILTSSKQTVFTIVPLSIGEKFTIMFSFSFACIFNYYWELCLPESHFRRIIKEENRLCTDQVISDNGRVATIGHEGYHFWYMIDWTLMSPLFVTRPRQLDLFDFYLRGYEMENNLFRVVTISIV
jgi:hypothetical protein